MNVVARAVLGGRNPRSLRGFVATLLPMASAGRAFQSPKGTRDLYPPDIAVGRHIESAWRDTAINHGFDEINGPTFEHLGLYTVKSGPGIVSELFSFRRAGGDVDYALRPEFTPTLARMYAAQAAALARPTKWFSIGPFFRAERPQRGRLREHVQLNTDIIGDDSPRADAEVVAVAVDILRRLGLTEDDVRVRIGDRTVVGGVLKSCGVAEAKLPEALELLDKRDRLPAQELSRRCEELSLDLGAFDAEAEAEAAKDALGSAGASSALGERICGLAECLDEIGVGGWCDFNLGIVRGLAYYTSTVFEIHEATGRERAIAGGGRYDNLVELFGGPPTPAVGIAMGDVVLGLVLKERQLLTSDVVCRPRPDAFVISAGKKDAQTRFRPLIASLRRDGLHVRHSYRTTHSVGKLLGEAARARARYAVILGDELARGLVVVKDLDEGRQREVPIGELAAALGRRT